MALSAAILVGGRGRRLGGCFKPLLSIGGRSILERQLEALHQAGIEHIALVGRWGVEERPLVPVFADAIEDSGALGALYTALLVAPTDPVLVVAGDMPFLDARLLRPLGRLDPDIDVTLPRTAEGLHPLCGGYRRSIARQLKTRIDRRELAVRDAVGALRMHVLDEPELSAIDSEAIMLMNVNTTADYERARQAARHRA